MFTNFKRKLRSFAMMMMRNTNMTREELLSIFYNVTYEAEESAFTSKVIKSSFRDTYIYPFDGEKILQLAKRNAGEVSKQSKA